MRQTPCGSWSWSPAPRAPASALEEIARLLPSGDGAWQHGELLEGLRRKVAEIEALQRRLEQNKAQLLVAIESIENKPDGLQCTENTQRVLERLREEGPPRRSGVHGKPARGVLSHAGGAAAFRRLTLKST